MKRPLIPGAAMILMGGLAFSPPTEAAPIAFTQAGMHAAIGPSSSVQRVEYYMRGGHRYWRAPPPRHRAPPPRRDVRRP